MAFTPYLSFQGEAADAFAFYAEVFGGTAQLMRFSDIPPGENMPEMPQDQREWVMHASLDGAADGMLMGADMPPQFGGGSASAAEEKARIALTRPGVDEARALFDRLAQGGKVTMPFAPTFFAAGFGMCADRFGTQWMISAEAQEDGQ